MTEDATSLGSAGERAGDAHADVVTLGCRLNLVESEEMRRHASVAGLGNAVIVNTCAVTGEAMRQAAQSIRRIRREKPDARIIVTGCAAQIEPQKFSALAEVDHVIGNSEKLRSETYAAIAARAQPRVAVNDIMTERVAHPSAVDHFTGHTRAFVQVQNGCDHRCTFCIIPFGRGRSRSVPEAQVIAQVRRLVDSGYREVVLTGVDITSYGADLPERPALGKLVRALLKSVPELERLRLSSIDQVETDPDLMIAFAEEPRLMPYLHLSMQSGDDIILKRMKRRHSRAQAIAFCEHVRKARPDMVFGADLIAGFPTETDQMFGNTLSMVEDCGLSFLHVFPFSSRPGTPAARMPQLASHLVTHRANKLRAKGADVRSRFHAAQKGRTFDCLMERGNIARTPHFAKVRPIGGERYKAGEMLALRIVGSEADVLIGDLAA